mmetsp:Transcript_37048/g.85558  ORF Transcript_37048/g.85558 Transcript_37048/m.85558 type:complete len:425 (+) Transcript_37048:108-1382(+)
MYGTLLQSQLTSPVLNLAHTGIGDSGALEIAHFISTNEHIRRADLRGNDITSTGIMHIAKALKLNLSLQSLVLMHNKIGEAGEVGIAILAEALKDNTTLKHLDLRHNALKGAAACKHIGEMLKHNKCLSHLDLSWNELQPAGGQVLLEAIRRDNSTLFDCQLTGCHLAEQTLEHIAAALHRNRRAKEAVLKAGPYEMHLEDGWDRPTDGDFVPVPPVPFQDLGPLSGVAASQGRTAEHLARLDARMSVAAGKTSLAGARKAHELRGLLQAASEDLQQEQRMQEEAREHLQLLSQSFTDRELRYRRSMALIQEQLLEFGAEERTLQGIRSRLAEDLRLQREICSRASDQLEIERQQHDVDEARARGHLQHIQFDCQALQKRLEELTDKAEVQEEQVERLREKTLRCREDLILHQPRTVATAEAVT